MVWLLRLLALALLVWQLRRKVIDYSMSAMALPFPIGELRLPVMFAECGRVGTARLALRSPLNNATLLARRANDSN
jgi:hypothetical protein